MRHHYIPVFYLNYWRGANRQICEFSRPFRKVVPKRVFPAGTGFVDDLYSLRGLQGQTAHDIERLFFAPVDNLAADACRKLHQERIMDITIAERSAWARFLTSLLLRSPHDIEALRRHVRSSLYNENDPDIRAAYRAAREDGDPETFDEWAALSTSWDAVDRSCLSMLPRMIDHQGVGNHIVNMLWFVLKLGRSANALLTSDRPVIMTNGLSSAESYLVIPLNEGKIFCAANDIGLVDYLNNSDPRNLSHAINKTVVTFARKYVWGKNDSALGLVQKEFATRHAPTLIEQVSTRSADQRGSSVGRTSFLASGKII